MNKLLKKPLSIFLFLTAVTGVLFLTSGESRAQGGPCVIEVTKVAEGGEGLIFDFQVQIGDIIGQAQFIGGATSPALFGQGEPATLTELPNPGWELVDVSCEEGPGVSLTVIEGGVIAECLQPQGGGPQGQCTFVNVRVSNIPTLSEWGMISAAVGLVLIGVFYAVRKKKAAVNS